MNYVYLMSAIVSEVVATSALKSSAQFTRPVPSLIVVIGYGCSFYFLSLVLESIPLGVAYALWSGLGIVLVALVGIVVFKQTPDLPALIGMGLILGGVIVINVFSKTVSH